VITEIGATYFDPNTGTELDAFRVSIDPESAMKCGLRVDTATLLWWMKEEQRPALARWIAEEKLDLVEALSGFSQWMSTLDPDPKELAVWGYGATFDNVMLTHAFKAAGVDKPWTYRGEMCFRTLAALKKVERPPFLGTIHSALDDARHQALWMSLIVKELGITL
jgi:hypothetical protein